MELTHSAIRLQSISHRAVHLLPKSPNKKVRDTVSEPQDAFEASRTDKMNAIEALGLDPWGSRFDGHRPIAEIRNLPLAPEGRGAGGEGPPPQRARIAGRIVLRRTMGNAHFLDLWDWTGRIQVMIGKKQVGEQGWALAKLLDLGDLLGVEGNFGKTKTGELT